MQLEWSVKRPSWWGSRRHIVYTIAVFVVLASLDNMAVGIPIPLYPLIARDLGVSEASVGFVTALGILITGATAFAWGYWGDRGDRKRLLLVGSAFWAIGVFGSGAAQGYWQFLAAQVVAAVGFGCVVSVGFSVISDFVPPSRRGLILSLWGISQGVGTGLGFMTAGLLAATSWRAPFFLVTALGVLFALLYVFAYSPQRGRNEKELAATFRAGLDYEHRIQPSDLALLVRKWSNIWLVLSGFVAQFAYGSLIWLPRLFTSKAEAAGYSLEMATAAGSMFAIIFQVGGLFSILGGYLGDRWQRRNPRGRTFLAAIGIAGAIPFFLILFFMPMPNLGGGAQLDHSAAVAGAVLLSLFTDPWIAAAFVIGLVALALTAVDSPNWFALISDVNLPEHRGTVFGLANLASGVGRALGNGLTGVVFVAASAWASPPLNFAIGLALFQAFFIPTALCYLLASRTVPVDIARVKRTLAQRARVVPLGPM